MRRLQTVTRAQAQKRQYFYDAVTEQQKAGFIFASQKRGPG